MIICWEGNRCRRNRSQKGKSKRLAGGGGGVKKQQDRKQRGKDGTHRIEAKDAEQREKNQKKKEERNQKDKEE